MLSPVNYMMAVLFSENHPKNSWPHPSSTCVPVTLWTEPRTKAHEANCFCGLVRLTRHRIFFTWLHTKMACRGISRGAPVASRFLCQASK